MPAARLPLRPSRAVREATLAAVTARLQLRRDHARLALGLFLGRATDAEVDSLADASRSCRVRNNVHAAAAEERARRDRLDCPYAEHVEENPYNGVVLCHGCGATLYTCDY